MRYWNAPVVVAFEVLKLRLRNETSLNIEEVIGMVIAIAQHL